MTTTPDRFEEIAADLMFDIDHEVPCIDGRVRAYEMDEWRASGKKYIADAIRAAATVQPGHVRLDDGREVKVLARKSLLGTTQRLWPMTKDGCAIVPGCTIYWPSGVDAAVLAVWFDDTLDLQSHDENGIPVNSWKRLRYDGDAYSTRAAAEAARGKGEE